MHYSAPYTIPSRYGGTGYGSGSSSGNGAMLRRPSYVSQLSSDGYSSAGGSYANSYGPTKYRDSGRDFIPGGASPFIGSQSRTHQFGAPQQQPSSNYYRDRPNSVAGVANPTDYGNKNSYNSGYNSDYGRSGYASGNNSDYGQSGYVSGASDYRRSYSSSKNYGDRYEPSYRRSRTTSEHSKGMSTAVRSSYASPSPARYSSYTRSSGSGSRRSDSAAVADYCKSGKVSSGRTNYSLQASPYTVNGRSGGLEERRGSYSRSVSREVSPVKLVKVTSGTVNNMPNRMTPDSLARKTKNCKAPADFTSDSSTSSSSTEDNESDDSPNEDAVNTYVICRSTSPTQKPPRNEVEKAQSISSIVKMKKTSSSQAKFSDNCTQTTYEDFHPTQKSSSSDISSRDRGRSARYIPSTTTKLSSGYYDRYYNKYTSPLTTSRSITSSRPTLSGGNLKISGSSSKSEIGSVSNRSSNISGSKLNLRQVSRQNSREDCKSTPSSPQHDAQTNFKLSLNNSGTSVNNSNTDVANKEYRKSVLNMNVNDVDDGKCDKGQERRTQLSKSQSRVTNLNKSPSQTKAKHVEHSSSTSTTSSSSSDEQVTHQRPPSRLRLNSERANELEKHPSTVSTSKSNHDVRNRSSKGSQEDILDKKCRKGSKEGIGNRSRKNSHEGMLDDKRRSSREEVRRRPRSKQGSNDDNDSSDDNDNRTGRSSALRRRRRSSKEDHNRSTPKRQSSVEGIIDDLPPRPSRQGSRESILDDRPNSKSASKVNSQNSSRENLLSDEKSTKSGSQRKSNSKASPSPPVVNCLGPGRWIVSTDNQARESPSKSPTFQKGKDKIGNTGEEMSDNARRSKSPNASNVKKQSGGMVNNEKFIGHYKDIDNLLDGDRKESFDDFEEKYQVDNRLIIVTAPPVNNLQEEHKTKKDDAKRTVGHFIGICQDIDDVLGKVQVRPTALALKKSIDESDDDNDDTETNSSAGEEVEAHVVKVHDSKAQQPQFETYTEEIDSSAVRIRENKAVTPELEVYTEEIDASGIRIKNHPKAMKGKITITPTPKRLEHSCTVQHIPKANKNQYFDSKPQRDADIVLDNRKNVLPSTTNKQLAQVNSVIDKLSHLEGKDLQQTLFSLKQLFQDDQNLVNGFVRSNGLSHLIKIGFESDSTYQNYILRALGQIMLNVNGMAGVTAHIETIQWLYSLISSKFRAIAKTALKLLTVFVEYEESNCLLLINAINSVDSSRGMKPWTNVMMLLNEKESVDMDSLTVATALINKTLRGISDQDTYYEVVDSLEVQGMERIIQRYMSKQGSDLELLHQFQTYESVLRQEDGDEERQFDSNQNNQMARAYKKDNCVRRKSFRHLQTNVPVTPPTRQMVNQNPVKFNDSRIKAQRDSKPPNVTKKSSSESKLNDLNGVTPALRRRREREAQNRKESEGNALLKDHQDDSTHTDKNARVHIDEENRKNKEISRIPCRVADNSQKLSVQQKSSGPYHGKCQEDDSQNVDDWSHHGDTSPRLISQAEVFDLRRENTVKDIQKKLRSQDSLQSPTDTGYLGDFSGLVNKAKEGLNKSSSRTEIKASVLSPVEPHAKTAENDLQWEQLKINLDKPLTVKDLDFTDLISDDDDDAFNKNAGWGKGVGPPCPPPPPLPCPMLNPRFPLPPQMPFGGPPPPKFGPPPPPLLANHAPPPPPTNQKTIKKNKKTVKLFWKEVSDDHSLGQNNNKNTSIWDELKPVNVDTQKLEHLFENRAKDLMNKKQQDINKNKEIVVLDPKRSNAINIGMTKLPPPRTIKTAILKMDSSIINREGIEKILTTMIPTEEEVAKIVEAQMSNPDVPLGSAEQFLLTLASVTELTARLKLWAFKLDYDVIEKEVADPLMDLKQGIQDLKKNTTFRCILATLLSIGNFLNGIEAKGFQIDYLTKVPEVKDTVHKHSLLHHLFHVVMEKFPDTTDLYSEIGAITRAAKVDFDEVAFNLVKLETECKASWDHLKAISKHDGTASGVKSKMSEFLAECAEQIIILGIIHRRILNRFFKFLLYLGVPLRSAKEMKINIFLKTISEFALEYRTTRERVLQQMEKKISHRERNKTKGKFFVELAKSKEVQADDELRQLLGGMSDSDDYKWGTVPGVRGRLRKPDVRAPVFNRSSSSRDESMTDGDEDIFESLAKSYRNNPRERRKLKQIAKK